MLAVYPVEKEIDEIYGVLAVVVAVEKPGDQKTANAWDHCSERVLVNAPDEEQVEIEEKLNDENDVEVVISTNCHYGTLARRTQSPS